jgi:hypothetical protein
MKNKYSFLTKISPDLHLLSLSKLEGIWHQRADLDWVVIYYRIVLASTASHTFHPIKSSSHKDAVATAADICLRAARSRSSQTRQGDCQFDPSKTHYHVHILPSWRRLG